MNVFYDMTRNGGGWTTFQQRLDGSVDLYRYWVDYKKGFGEADAEYCIGWDWIAFIKSPQNIQMHAEDRSQRI